MYNEVYRNEGRFLNDCTARGGSGATRSLSIGRSE